jgi:ubiquinone/menaquinone biosynthesis C-methylase UbiE
MPIWQRHEAPIAEPDPDLPFDTLYQAFKAAGETTRLRILALLAETELTVSDLTEILRQSQPRVSRHLKLLTEAGLVARSPEGSWAFFRLADVGPGARVIREALAELDPADPAIAHDRQRLSAVRADRANAAREYFARHAANWDRIRRLHVADQRVEQSILTALSGQPYRSVLDLGTGTGRMLELLGPRIERGLGFDLSPEMLTIARANLDRAGLRHCRVRQGDLYSLGLSRNTFDVVVIHQVLHLLDDAAGAIREAAGVLRPHGRLVIVDFAPHDQEFLRVEHAHRRLGFANETISQWMDTAGLDLITHESLTPEPDSAAKIAISLWVGRDRRPQANDELDYQEAVA